MNIKTVYLVLAIIGAVVPYAFFIQYFGEAGFEPTGFVMALFVNPVAGGFTLDLVISSLVFWVAIIRPHQRGGGPNPAVFILLNLSIGLSCALPAYLYAASGSLDSARPA